MSATIIRPDFRRARHEWPPIRQSHGVDWHRADPDEHDGPNIEPLPWPEATRRIFFACAAFWLALGFAMWRW